MSTIEERTKAPSEVDAFLDYIEKPPLAITDLREGYLYGGQGGNIARIGIYDGVNPGDNSPEYTGYTNTQNGPIIISEVDLRHTASGKDIRANTFVKGTFFGPAEEIGPVPSALLPSPNPNLLDWLITQDIAYVTARLRALDEIRHKFGKLSMYAEVYEETQALRDLLSTSIRSY